MLNWPSWLKFPLKEPSDIAGKADKFWVEF
jgi:hypothetical protein